jgi:hypothetical protein
MALQRRKTNKIGAYIKKLKENDYFENRYDFDNQSTYLYNPYTGESCQEVSLFSLFVCLSVCLSFCLSIITPE